MPVQNLNNGLLNGVAGSYGTPTGLDPVYPNIANLDRTRKAVTFCDFFGGLGDFSCSVTPLFNDITTNLYETKTNNVGAGGLWLNANSVTTIGLGIRKGSTVGSQGGASLIRPFVFETSYEMLNASTATNNYVMYFGLDNQLTTNPQENNFNGSAVWFEYNHAVNSGNWQFKASLFDASFNFAQTTINTSFSASTSSLFDKYRRKLKIEKQIFGDKAGVFRGYIDDILIGEISVTENQQIFPANVGEARVVIRKTASTNNSRISFDYLYYETDVLR
jgi:hypothetical protein